jgi:hypothetical protein
VSYRVSIVLLLLLVSCAPMTMRRPFVSLLPEPAHVVTLKRIGLYRRGAFYVGANPCQRVLEVEARLRTVSLLVPPASIRTCGDPSTSVTVPVGGSIGGHRLDARGYFVGCVRGATLPAAVVLHVRCAGDERPGLPSAASL